MTKRRFRLGLAALAILMALILALFDLVLGSTHAVADKNFGVCHRTTAGSDSGPDSGTDPIYSEHHGWNEQDKIGWNGGPACDGKTCPGPDGPPQYYGGDGSPGSPGSSDGPSSN